MPADLSYTVRLRRHSDTSNTLGQLPNENGPTSFDDQLDNDVQDWHPGIVALSAGSVKKGKTRLRHGLVLAGRVVEQVLPVGELGGPVIEP
jgi:hypothetical protein